MFDTFSSPRDAIPGWAAPDGGGGDVATLPRRGAVAVDGGAVPAQGGPVSLRVVAPLSEGPAAAVAVTVAARRLAELAASCASWSPQERSVVLAELDRAAGAVALARSRVLTGHRDEGTGVGIGDRDLASARARQTRAGLGEARREVELADTLDRLPTLAGAVGAGVVPLAHADALARVSRSAGETARERLATAATQAELIALAGRLPVKEFRAAAERMVASWDPPATERNHDAQYQARFLILSQTPEGTYLRGRLDRVAGAAFRVALDGIGIAPGADRTKEQADADALAALVERATSGQAGVRAWRAGAADDEVEAQRAADTRVSGTANRPTVCVLVPAETVAALTGVAAEQRTAAGPALPGGPTAQSGAAPSAPVLSGPSHGAEPTVPAGPPSLAAGLTLGLDPAVLDDGTVLAPSVLARFLCDSAIGRAVLDQDSMPLDLGRTSRLFSPAQRRAAIIRDRTCIWNGCDVPAAYTEVHHIRWWDRDLGPTDLAEACLVCSHHHHVIHQHDLVITRLPRRGAPVDLAGHGSAVTGAGQGRAGPGRTGRAGRAAPPGRLGEPVRYLITDGAGRIVDAPPDHGAPAAATPGGLSADPAPSGQAATSE